MSKKRQINAFSVLRSVAEWIVYLFVINKMAMRLPISRSHTKYWTDTQKKNKIIQLNSHYTFSMFIRQAYIITIMAISTVRIFFCRQQPLKKYSNICKTIAHFILGHFSRCYCFMLPAHVRFNLNKITQNYFHISAASKKITILCV